MTAGELDYRWALQERQAEPDGFGGTIVTYPTVATVWGSWEPLKGTEQWAAQQAVEKSVARVRFRYADGKVLTATHRIEHDTLGPYEIIGAPEQRRREGSTVCQVSRIVE